MARESSLLQFAGLAAEMAGRQTGTPGNARARACTLPACPTHPRPRRPPDPKETAEGIGRDVCTHEWSAEEPPPAKER